MKRIFVKKTVYQLHIIDDKDFEAAKAMLADDPEAGYRIVVDHFDRLTGEHFINNELYVDEQGNIDVRGEDENPLTS